MLILSLFRFDIARKLVVPARASTKAVEIRFFFVSLFLSHFPKQPPLLSRRFSTRFSDASFTLCYALAYGVWTLSPGQPRGRVFLRLCGFFCFGANVYADSAGVGLVRRLLLHFPTLFQRCWFGRYDYPPPQLRPLCASGPREAATCSDITTLRMNKRCP